MSRPRTRVSRCVNCGGPIAQNKPDRKRCRGCYEEQCRVLADLRAGARRAMRRGPKLRMNESEALIRLGEIKIAIVRARRAGMDGLAAVLSAEKAAVKKRIKNHCQDCGVPVTGKSARCRMHSTRHRHYGRALNLAAKN